MDLFSAEEFSVWVGARHSEVPAAIPLTRDTSAAQQVFLLLEALQRRQLIDARFFADVLAERPNAATDIEATRQTWLRAGSVAPGQGRQRTIVIVCHESDDVHRVQLCIQLMALQEDHDFVIWYRSGVFFERARQELEQVQHATVIEVLASSRLLADPDSRAVLAHIRGLPGKPPPLVHVTQLSPYLQSSGPLRAFKPRPNQPITKLDGFAREAHWVALCGEIVAYLASLR